jgi:hypothetical protein
VERTLVKVIVRRKKNWIGHVMRGDELLKRMLREEWRKRDREEGQGWE